MSWTTWLGLWLRELWIEVTEQPMRLVPHPRVPVQCGPADGYRCRMCGSRSARVQEAGQRVAQARRAAMS